jgi:hypothetical protein
MYIFNYFTYKIKTNLIIFNLFLKYDENNYLCIQECLFKVADNIYKLEHFDVRTKKEMYNMYTRGELIIIPAMKYNVALFLLHSLIRHSYCNIYCIKY